MAVTKIEGVTIGNQHDYIGLSTDTKPTDCAAGSTYKELDTKKDYIYDGTTWWEV